MSDTGDDRLNQIQAELTAILEERLGAVRFNPEVPDKANNTSPQDAASQTAPAKTSTSPPTPATTVTSMRSQPAPVPIKFGTIKVRDSLSIVVND